MSNIIIQLTEPQVWAIAIACAFMVMDILTGFILVCMLGCEFFINYRMIFRRKQAEAPAAPAAAESDQTESKEDASC